MASAAPPLPIYYNPDVHDFYTKQKQEFHFQQKSDNEFMLFLLDTAVRVISIVQHLAPVIEAVSDANTDVEDDDDVSQTVTPTVTLSDPGNMEVDSTQIPLNTGILPTLRTQSFADRTQIPDHPDPTHISSQNIVDHSVSQSTKPIMQRATTRSTSKLSAVLAPSDLVEQEVQPNIPTKHQPSSGQASHNIPTSVSHSSQPVAEPANVDYKMEDTPDVIEIKEEMEEVGAPSSELLTPENLQQLMTSISGVDGSVQNFVPTATSLPPLLLDRNANNSLSMVGSRSGPGPAGLTLPDTLMKSITEGGIKLTDMKGASNSSTPLRTFSRVWSQLEVIGRHRSAILPSHRVDVSGLLLLLAELRHGDFQGLEDKIGRLGIDDIHSKSQETEVQRKDRFAQGLRRTH